MAILLHVDSSPLHNTSVSRELTRHFVAEWKSVNPEGSVISRDLSTTFMAPVSAEWIAANFTPPEKRTTEQRAQLELSDSLVAELQSADQYVFGVPMHNFSVPSTLKLWIDLVTRVGLTFAYVDRKPLGLLTGKKATILSASGGNYAEGTALEPLNFLEPYLRAVFDFVGVTSTKFINAGNTAALLHGGDRADLLAPHLSLISEKIRAA